LERIEIDYMKVDPALAEDLPIIERINNRLSSTQWDLGRFIVERVKSWNQAEVKYYLQRVQQDTGVQVKTIMRYMNFYQKFPNLPALFEKTKIPISWFRWLSRHRYECTQVRCRMLQLSRNTFENFTEFKQYCREEFDLKVGGGEIPSCLICGVQVIPEMKNDDWFVPCVHKDCWNKFVEVANELEELKKENVALKILVKQAYRHGRVPKPISL
jgi:hypothetical protein